MKSILLNERQQERQKVCWGLLYVPHYEPESLLGGHCQWAFLKDEFPRLVADVGANQVL